MINGQLDETDHKILYYLQEDARMDLKRLSKLVCKSISPTSRRIHLLQEAGYIQKSVIVLDRKLIGKPVLVIVMVLLERQTSELLRQFQDTVCHMPEVQHVLHLSGKWDFMLHVSGETPQGHYAFLMDKLCSLPNVAHVESSFVLNECKTFSPLKL